MQNIDNCIPLFAIKNLRLRSHGAGPVFERSLLRSVWPRVHTGPAKVFKNLHTKVFKFGATKKQVPFLSVQIQG